MPKVARAPLANNSKAKLPGAFRISDDVMAYALNRSTVRSNRNLNKKDYLIHVSDLIKTEKAFQFCPREHVFNYHSTKSQITGGSLSPGRELLFSTGHFLHEHVIKKFLANSSFAQYAYGLWVCNCNDHWKSDFKGKKQLCTYGQLDRKTPCKLCNAVNDNYVEIDLISRKFGITGHPDFLLLYNGVYIIYEFKTVDRSDITFDNITQPFFDHRVQASFYYYIATENKMKCSSMVRVLYIDRSNSKLMRGEPFKEFKVPVVSLEKITEYTSKLSGIETGKKSGWLPGRICGDIRASRAKNCEHCLECFERKSNYAKPGRIVKMVA